MKTRRALFIVAPVALSFLLNNAYCVAQMPQQFANPNQTAMMVYPVELGPDGRQYITTRAGYKVTVPGLDLAPNASQIAVFRDPQNNFWYVDKNGSQTPVSPQQMQSVMSQMQAQSMQHGQAQYNQYPQGMPPQNMYGQAAAPMAPAATAAPVAASQPQQSSNNNNNSGNNGTNTAMMSGLAAAGGAAMGSMLTNSMYNNNNNSGYGYGGIPYGTPVYKQPNGQYYYNDQAGKAAYVQPNSTNTAALNQYAQQNAYTGKPYSETANSYNEQQAASTYKQQQNEQKAESAYHQNQNEQKAESMHKQQQIEQAAGQDNEGSGRRRRHKEEATSGAQSNQARATGEENGSGRRKRFRNDESGSGQARSALQGNDDSGRLGGRFRQ
jgi:hypothetical protein